MIELPDPIDTLTQLTTPLLDTAPPLYKFLIYLIILLTVLAICGWLIVGAYRFAKSINKESQAFDLAEKNAQLNKENLELEKSINNICNSMEAMNTYIIKTEQTIRYLNARINTKDTEITKELIESEIGRVISDFINLLSSELSYGNRTRVSLWTLNSEKNNLEPLYRSSNFPNSKNTSKILDINQSIAGRALRTGEFQYSEDLNSDPDWKQYFSNTYKAIVAVPVDESRILTIDFKKIPPKEDQLFAQTAASLLSYLYSMTLPLKSKVETSNLNIVDILNELNELLEKSSSK